MKNVCIWFLLGFLLACGASSALALQPGQAGWNTSVLSFEDAKRAADNGDAYAQAVVSIYYSLGWKTEKNVEEAFKYAVASAKAGNPLGMYRVGSALRSGDGTEKNEQQGLTLHKKSFDGLKKMGGNPYAITSLGVMIFQGKATKENKPEAARLYKVAADMGYAPAQFNYAMCAKDGHGIPTNKIIFDDYLSRAIAGDYPIAKNFVSETEDMRGVGQANASASSQLSYQPNQENSNNAVLSFENAKQAADKSINYITAPNILFVSFEEAKRAADHGDAYAQAVVSLYYSLGWKTEKNLPAALKYATASAKAGNPLGIYRLGTALRNGEGTEKNEQQGLALQKQSFAGLQKMRGNPYALTSLGVLFFQGKVTQEHKPEAARLYKRAADKGYAPAEFNYAMCAKDGHGIPTNKNIFADYLSRAIADNYPPAKGSISETENRSGVGQTNALPSSHLSDQPKQGNWNNKVLSFEDAKLAADNGDAYAQAVVSIYYFHGWKTEKNVLEALKYARASAKAGNPLGICQRQEALSTVQQRRIDSENKDEFTFWEDGTISGIIEITTHTKVFHDLNKMNGNPYAITFIAAIPEVTSYERTEQQTEEAIQTKRKEAAMLVKTAADIGYAPAQFEYAMMAANGVGMPKNEDIFRKYIQEAAHMQYPSALQYVKNGIVIPSYLKDYEFQDAATSGQPSIADKPSGVIVFQNQDWIVMASFRSAAMETKINFYDAKSLKLTATARVPNMLIKLGLVGSAFYGITITHSRYFYTDDPLVVTLFDPKTKDIDKVSLVEDDAKSLAWGLVRATPILISAESNSIVLHYDPYGIGAGYSDIIRKTELKMRKPQNKHFADINILMKPVSSELISQLLDPEDIHKKEFEKQSGNGLASLNSVGIIPSKKIEFRFPDAPDRVFVGDVSLGKSKGLHMVRATPDGSLHDITLDALKSEDYKIAASEPISPGVFDDGTLYCVDNRSLFLIKNGISTIVDIADSNVFFDKSHAYAMPPSPKDQLWMKRRPANLAQFSWLQIDASGQKQKMKMPSIKVNKNSDIGGDPSKSRDSISVYPEKSIYYTVIEQGYFDFNYCISRFSLNDGQLLGSQINAGTGKGLDANDIYDGIAPNGWHAVCVLTDHSSSGRGYSIYAKKDNGEKDFILAQTLPELTDCLEMRINEQGVLHFLYSCAGETKYAEYLSNGESKILAEWKYSAIEGKPLLLSEKNLIFIPKAGGYDAYRVFQGSKAEKAFEIFFRGSSDYVIILPNGYYAGSPGCEKLFTIKAGDGTVDASTLAPWKNRPAEIITALGGDPKDAALLSQVTARWLKRLGFDPSQKEPKASEILKVSVSQMPPLWAAASTVSFPIEVTVGAEPIKEVVVRVNGVIQKRYTDASLNVQPNGSAMIHASVNLAEGQNWIEVSAIDSLRREGNIERFRTILRNAQDTPKRYIIAMGCSEYERSALNLQYAVKDATDVLTAFSETGGRESKTLLLTNKDANQAAIEKIKAFTADTKESDEIILFCAGHGMLDENLDYVYAGHNFDPEHPSQTGIKLDDLIASISGGKSLKRLILMDTCHSGQVGEKEEMKLAQMDTALPRGVRAIKNRGMKAMPVATMTGMDQQRFIEELFLLPGIHRGVNIVGASGGAEYAMESSQWNNGVFTSAIIEALRDKKADINKQGKISVSDLKNYLAKRVAELTGGAQKPSVVAFEQDQNFDLVRNMASSPNNAINPKGATTASISQNKSTTATPSLSVLGQSAQPTLGKKFTNSLQQPFVPIPGTDTYFCIWSTRVADYEKFVKDTNREWKAAGFKQEKNHPAVRINYHDATEFCKWLTAKEHTLGILPFRYEYRLPKDLEWSAAAGIGKEVDGTPASRSGGIPSCYAWGNTWPPPVGSGNYDPKLKTDKYESTSPVGSFNANKYGLYDMNGNVYQWIYESFNEDEQGCLRGGSWPDDAEESINLTNRFPAPLESKFKCYGFRCVLAPSNE